MRVKELRKVGGKRREITLFSEGLRLISLLCFEIKKILQDINRQKTEPFEDGCSCIDESLFSTCGTYSMRMCAK